ncbi:PREDICTED: uncharacterized protein LOC109174088 [Ipomoea nil]|uniref:uncharacterized protein LOC109174088 n=1 Tax=Ipomoea nil TaxID=35883 RepID=UPI000900F62F|nr:PREDICTED: uncharacterized protein LOC109174088 [Ipomoea nil]
MEVWFLAGLGKQRFSLMFTLPQTNAFGNQRLKQHLAAGYGDVAKCPKTTTEIMREMQQYMQGTSRMKRSRVVLDDNVDDDVQESAREETQPSSHDSVTYPSSGTASKRKQTMLRFVEPQPRVGKKTQSVASLLRKTPEEVVDERHSKGPTQRTIEACTKSKEETKRTMLHIAVFFYENGIPFNAANSRSFEVMVESIGQWGLGLKPPSFHELRVPLLLDSKQVTDKLKERHRLAWKQYGCTLMSDGWTDKRGRHLINFLVNSPEGTFFLESVDASSESHDARMLAGLLEQKVEEVGKENVIQIVTGNGAIYKAAGKLLEERIRTLFWTPCAAHCLDLMLEDIGKMMEFKSKIASGRNITTFIYRHGRILSAMREHTGGQDLSLYKHKNALRALFVSEDWVRSKLSNTEAGKTVCEIVLSYRFWTAVEDCLRASHPILIVLRIVDADSTPAMPELTMAMLAAKKKLNESFASKPRLFGKLMAIVERRWDDQMGVDLYGAALFLNPSKYFDLKATDSTCARKQRAMFNTILHKMIGDDDLQVKIINQADNYDNMRNDFGMPLAVKQQKAKTHRK